MVADSLRVVYDVNLQLFQRAFYFCMVEQALMRDIMTRYVHVSRLKAGNVNRSACYVESESRRTTWHRY
jgi:hypothetical protein